MNLILLPGTVYIENESNFVKYDILLLMYETEFMWLLQTLQVGGDTISWIRFVARPQDNGQNLTCRAWSRSLTEPPVSQTVILNVTREYICLYFLSCLMSYFPCICTLYFF